MRIDDSVLTVDFDTKTPTSGIAIKSSIQLSVSIGLPIAGVSVDDTVGVLNLHDGTAIGAPLRRNRFVLEIDNSRKVIVDGGSPARVLGRVEEVSHRLLRSRYSARAVTSAGAQGSLAEGSSGDEPRTRGGDPRSPAATAAPRSLLADEEFRERCGKQAKALILRDHEARKMLTRSFVCPAGRGQLTVSTRCGVLGALFSLR